MRSESDLAACHLGPTPYPDGVRLQLELLRARAADRTGDWLLFADHPPVLTIGRGGGADNLRADAATLARRGVALHEASRGGDVTWHGPGQLVGYPIVGLEAFDRDLHRYLRTLEQALIRVLAGFGLEAGTVPGRTGVWIDGRKIASIGIAVRAWVAYHGFALNVNPDLSYFDLIHPCGLRGVRMTSLAAELGDRAPGIAEVREAAARELAAGFGMQLRWAARPAVERACAPEDVPAVAAAIGGQA